MNIPRDKTVQDLFKWRVEQTPDLVAHKFLDRETSYKELDLLSNCLLYTSPSPRDS